MIDQQLNFYLSRFEACLKQTIDKAEVPATRVKEAIYYTLFPGGKRFRPILVYLAGKMMDIDLPCLDKIAIAVELIHAYSLIHDDLPAIDNDDFRRGKPSCHRQFDEATAILVGDGMQALAIDVLLTGLPNFLTDLQVINVTRQLVQASGFAGMVSGQSLDLTELTNGNKITASELCHIHELKTGRLILACIKMTVAAGKPSESLKTALQQYAAYLGLVFQIQDDYLDFYAPVNQHGKNRASDSANQKMTFANLYDQNQLIKLIDTYFQQAKDALKPFSGKVDELLALTQALQVRNKFN